MKKFLSIAACVLALTMMVTGAAFAEDGGFYASIKAGGSFLDASKTGSNNATGTGASSKFKTDSAFVVGGAVGYDWMGSDLPIRTELEYMYHDDFKYQYSDSNATLTNKINLQTVMLNGYWDFHNSSSFTPYINGGVGMAWVNEKYSASSTLTAPSSSTTTNFAANIGAGVGWSLTESVILDLAYRYDYYGNGKKVTATGTNSVTSQIKDIATHNVLLGLRYNF